MNAPSIRWLSGLGFALALLMPGMAGAAAHVEVPFLAEQVKTGQLPAIAERLPANPSVVDLDAAGKEPGRYGGDLRVLMGKARDVRRMVVYGYARLVAYDQDWTLVPDILAGVDVEADRVFTLHLRKGHKWSDGHPFTSEDFRYFWEDIANNAELSPVGVPRTLLVDGEPPEVAFPDPHTVRYAWSKPNPFFLPALAGARALYIYAPAHYLRQFHSRYGDVEALAQQAEAMGVRGWAPLHNRMDKPYKNENVDLPTLQPWVNTTRPPSQRFVFVRNPYFHRVDSSGHQLPYIDRVLMEIADGKLVPAKTGAGETDLQARHLAFSDYTFLKQSEGRTGNRVLAWETTKGAHFALFPNLNASDATWRKLLRDARFRRALSLAIDRNQVNQSLYYGLATEGANTIHARCPLYRPEYRSKWSEYDVAQANALLDAIGLSQRNDKGIRLLPDGRPMVMVVETAGEDTEQTDVLALIHDDWIKVGIKLFSKPIQREVFRNRIFTGETLMAVWGGLENGLPTAETSPEELAPTKQTQLQWPKWGQHFETKGKAGESPDLPEAQRLLALNQAWLAAPDAAKRKAIWAEMLGIHADQVYTIGVVAAVPQPVVINKRLRNVPEKAVYNWDPGAHFGVYRPDTFWLAPKQ